MPRYRMGNGFIHIKMTNTKKHPAPAPCAAQVPATETRAAYRCCAMSTKLCDWPMIDGGTCDAPLCEDHAHSVGEDLDYCPTHYRRHLAGNGGLF